MTFSCDIDPALKDFSGLVPLFPLPNVVLFPNALLPLHVFEPRYRQMTADVLEGERLIAMSLMRPGWEHLPVSAVPPIHRTVGLGKVIAHEKLDDGRYYLVLRGLSRAKLIGEQRGELPYRIGQFELCPDILGDQPPFNRQDRAEELASLFAQLFPGVNLQQIFLQAVTELPLGNVCDVLLGSLPMPSELSQQFLEALNVDTRSQMLLELLRQTANQSALGNSAATLHRSFPPDFSAN
jgi:Lon protease-like protein